MKKKAKLLIWIGCPVLFAILALLVFALVFAAERSRDPVFDPSPLIGLTKEEVLELAFDQYTKPGDELYILVPAIRDQVIRGDRHLSMMGCQYKTLEDAKNDDYLMSSDFWSTNERKKFSLSIIQKPVEVYVFYFEYGKVVNVETKNWYSE
jgi:hypothetical protein